MYFQYVWENLLLRLAQYSSLLLIYLCFYYACVSGKPVRSNFFDSTIVLVA